MSKKNLKEGGKKGGLSRSPRKKKAALANLKKANLKKEIWLQITELERLITSNREAWANASANSEVIKALDLEFLSLIDKKKKLEVRKM